MAAIAAPDFSHLPGTPVLLALAKGRGTNLIRGEILSEDLDGSLLVEVPSGLVRVMPGDVKAAGEGARRDVFDGYEYADEV